MAEKKRGKLIRGRVSRLRTTQRTRWRPQTLLEKLKDPGRRKWLYIAAGILGSLVTLLIFLIPWFLSPRLSDQQKEWKEFSGDDPNRYSLKVISHGYRWVQAYKTKERIVNGKPHPPATLVEWEWKVVIQNQSPQDLEVYVSYNLIDQDNLLVDVDSLIAKKSVPGGETVTIQNKTEMYYTDLARANTGAWELSWEEGKPSNLVQYKSRKKGF